MLPLRAWSRLPVNVWRFCSDCLCLRTIARLVRAGYPAAHFEDAMPNVNPTEPKRGRPKLSDAERAERAARMSAKPRRAASNAAHPLAHLVGLVPDALLAAILGCSASGVRKMRKAANLQPIGNAWALDASVANDVLTAIAALSDDRKTAAMALVRRYLDVPDAD